MVFDIHNDCPFVVVEYMAKGHVSLPKGHMEEGETEEETVRHLFLQTLNDYKAREIIATETKDIRTILYAKAFADCEDFDEEVEQ